MDLFALGPARGGCLYVKRPYTYYRGTEQCSSRAERVFFIQAWPPPLGHAPRQEIRAIARCAAFHQLGHFMMGTIRVGGKSITVTGGEDLNLDYKFGGFWPADSCKLDPDAHKAWNEGHLKSSASLWAVQKEFPTLADCLVKARKARPRMGKYPPQRFLP